MNLNQVADSLRSIISEGALILDNESFKNQEVKVKSLNSLVTEVDQNLEKFFVAELSKIIPEAGFIAEEGTSTKIGKTWNWIIDPLDGTTNFIHKIPCYCISIALKRDDEIVLGGIYEFNRKEYFEAIVEQGALLNGTPIHVSSTTTLSDSLLATGFPYYDFQYISNYLKLLEEFMQKSRGIRRLGSAALDLAYVACGRFDAFYEYGLHPWDVAAGSLIVREAGGVVSDFKGGNDYLFGREILASNPSVHSQVQSLLKRHFPAV